ncbi:MAG TPA: cupin domain-containing protein [Burkholderiales bacterium]|jgi:quercetin dioxygenase-like cupin family protein|nr:cupin domain-containing protein [Burkholderiales bacterium]
MPGRPAFFEWEKSMLKGSVLLGLLASLLLGGPAQAQQAPPQPSPVKRTPLGKVEVPGSNYEVVFGITELAAGFKSGRHSHPGQVLAYVADGEFWYLVDGQPERIYKVGESFQLPERAIHNEGAAGSSPVKVFAVFVVEKGEPLVQPAQPQQ